MHLFFFVRKSCPWYNVVYWYKINIVYLRCIQPALYYILSIVLDIRVIQINTMNNYLLSDSKSSEGKKRHSYSKEVSIYVISTGSIEGVGIKSHGEAKHGLKFYILICWKILQHLTLWISIMATFKGILSGIILWFVNSNFLLASRYHIILVLIWSSLFLCFPFLMLSLTLKCCCLLLLWTESLCPPPNLHIEILLPPMW